MVGGGNASGVAWEHIQERSCGWLSIQLEHGRRHLALTHVACEAMSASISEFPKPNKRFASATRHSCFTCHRTRPCNPWSIVAQRPLESDSDHCCNSPVSVFCILTTALPFLLVTPTSDDRREVREAEDIALTSDNAANANFFST